MLLFAFKQINLALKNAQKATFSHSTKQKNHFITQKIYRESHTSSKPNKPHPNPTLTCLKSFAICLPNIAHSSSPAFGSTSSKHRLKHKTLAFKAAISASASPF
jgi:hypothetical protein